MELLLGLLHGCVFVVRVVPLRPSVAGVAARNVSLCSVSMMMGSWWLGCDAVVGELVFGVLGSVSSSEVGEAVGLSSGAGCRRRQFLLR